MNESNLKSMDPAARSYFDSLPQTLKAQIVESGAQLCTREDLERYRKNALENRAQ